MQLLIVENGIGLHDLGKDAGFNIVILGALKGESGLAVGDDVGDLRRAQLASVLRVQQRLQIGAAAGN